ncbi:hypothetical protein A3731_22925 [Roseovarius sp. HI0049]|nr:hypothetical protein A3731_22925 [Roseovarius sp. HI0049]
MSKATWVIVWLTVANLVCVSLGTGLLIWTLCLTRGANKAAFKAVQVAVSQCRPWLKIDLEPIKVAHDKDTGRIKLSVRLTLENIGQSPAVDVRVYVLAYAWQVPLKTPIEKQAFVGARKRFSRFDGTDSFYGAIFPGDRRENRFETSAKTDLVLHPALTDAGRAMYEEKMTYDRIAPIVSFVITYKATGHDEDFTTEWGIGITSDGWNGFPLSPGDEVTNLVGTPHPPYMKAN